MTITDLQNLIKQNNQNVEAAKKNLSASKQTLKRSLQDAVEDIKKMILENDVVLFKKQRITHISVNADDIELYIGGRVLYQVATKNLGLKYFKTLFTVKG
jgi:hypothetical protein